MHEIVDLVNENDEVVGRALRAEAKSKRLLYRCAGVYVEMNGKILVELRSAEKAIRPLNWSIVEETLKAGESYEGAAVRGVKEELGLKAEGLEFVGKKIISDSEYPDNFVLGVFKCRGSGKIRLQEQEVSEVKLMSEGQMKKLVNLGKFRGRISPGFEQTIGMYLEARK